MLPRQRRGSRQGGRRMAAGDAVSGLSTDELMQLATELAGLSEAPLDSGVHVPGDGIKRVIFALDVNVGLLVLAQQLGYDAVIGHHPCATLLNQGEVYREHYPLVTRFG